MLGAAALALAFELERANAEQIAGRTDQRRAAPVGMRRRREDRLVEDVFPVAGELVAIGDARRHRALATAGAADHHMLADRDGAGGTDGERRQVDAGERLDKTEAGFLVIAEEMAGNDPAVGKVEPDRFGL